MPVSTGSDTRLYNPRSESNLGYTKDPEDYPHGIGDPEAMEAYKDKRMAEKDAEVDSTDLPHLMFEVPKPPPEMPEMPGMPMPEDEPVMDDENENAVGAEVSQMTGMPDMGNLSIGAATGTKPGAGGQLVNMSEPMDSAWSSLMKGRLDKVRGAEDKRWKQPQYKIQPGGADITTGTSRRAKLYSRHLQPTKHRGIDRAPLSVHRTHLGVATKQPLKLFPQKYGQQMGSMQRRKLMGNIPQSPAGHAMGPETTYSPRTPKVASSEGLKIRAPTGPKLMGQSLAKSEDLEELKKELESINKKMDYMHFAQMRRLLRRIKDSMENRERRLKAAVSGGPGENRESGHREGTDGTTKPEGGTENLEDDPKNWGAPSLLFAAKGSGRVG
tara:strand:+ start:3408 stop:4559 length:1152 start_codon:yes stop_codon:yes gene_type:complete